jgi:phage terminase large subunit-like protein
MQRPTSEEGAIIKREWWKVWKHDWIPRNCIMSFKSYDTAFLKKETADFQRLRPGDVFYPNQDSPLNLILLDAIKDRYEFPDLRRKALEQYKYWDPEMVIIEAKASGLPLTYELRQMDIPVVNFTPSKGNDKHVRVNSCAPSLKVVWYGRQIQNSLKK